MSVGPVCRWCYVMSRHRREGPIGSLRAAIECPRSEHPHPSLQATVRNTGPKIGITRAGASSKVNVMLQIAGPSGVEPPPLPKTVVDEVILAAERIVAGA